MSLIVEFVDLPHKIHEKNSIALHSYPTQSRTISGKKETPLDRKGLNRIVHDNLRLLHFFLNQGKLHFKIAIMLTLDVTDRYTIHPHM